MPQKVRIDLTDLNNARVFLTRIYEALKKDDKVQASYFIGIATSLLEKYQTETYIVHEKPQNDPTLNH